MPLKDFEYISNIRFYGQKFLNKPFSPNPEVFLVFLVLTILFQIKINSENQINVVN